jgi:hypothetical protein
MTTAKEELESLLIEMPEEEHKALSGICLGDIPMPVNVFSRLADNLPAETKRKYDPHLRQLRKLNALIRIAPDDNGKAEKQRQTPITLTSELTREISLSEVADILSINIKKDKPAKLITFCGMLLAQTNNDQFNVGYHAGSAYGKSYIALEVSAYFPKEEVQKIAFASPTSFYHDNADWDKERKLLIKDIEHKILIFIDMPHWQLLARLRPILSHDEKELLYKVTDKTQKYGMKVKNIIIRGYASFFFATTSANADEQEQTRMFLLSPEADQDKLRETIPLAALKQGNTELYRKTIQNDPRQQFMVDRILAIRQTGIREIYLPNDGKDVSDRFLEKHKFLMPRHHRDIVRICALIKAVALLNCFNRVHTDGKQDTILATKEDIEAGFSLYAEIEKSNELGLSQYVYEIYVKVIEPQLDEAIGLKRAAIRRKYYEIFHKPLATELEKDVIKQLEGTGLIEQLPDPDDKRKQLIYPTVDPNSS